MGCKVINKKYLFRTGVTPTIENATLRSGTTIFYKKIYTENTVH